MNTFNSTVKNKEVQCERLTYQVDYSVMKEDDSLLYFISSES